MVPPMKMKIYILPSGASYENENLYITKWCLLRKLIYLKYFIYELWYFKFGWPYSSHTNYL